jgi:hypothetical protein
MGRHAESSAEVECGVYSMKEGAGTKVSECVLCMLVCTVQYVGKSEVAGAS